MPLVLGLVPFVVACVAAILADARFSGDKGLPLEMLVLLLLDRLDVLRTIVLCGLMLS